VIKTIVCLNYGEMGTDSESLDPNLIVCSDSAGQVVSFSDFHPNSPILSLPYDIQKSKLGESVEINQSEFINFLAELKCKGFKVVQAKTKIDKVHIQVNGFPNNDYGFKRIVNIAEDQISTDAFLPSRSLFIGNVDREVFMLTYYPGKRTYYVTSLAGLIKEEVCSDNRRDVEFRVREYISDLNGFRLLHCDSLDEKFKLLKDLESEGYR
jgi:hypothetical protein